MVEKGNRRLSKEDWLMAALKMCEAGIDNVKVAPLAAKMGVTTGSFYWHFKNRRELLDALLEFWEREMTDAAMATARKFSGTPAERIYFIMETAMAHSLARYDLAICLWAQSDTNANRVFKRALKKRFAFAAWMFAQVGFSKEQAEIRGRIMVVYMMGEMTLVPDSMTKRLEQLRHKHAILVGTALTDAP